MKAILKTIVLLFFISSFHNVFATQSPGNIQAIMSSDTSIELDWQDVNDVLGYYIYYWESSGSWSEYDVEWVDLIETSDHILTNLTPETKYYIAVTAVDDVWSESEKSPELEAMTLALWEMPQSTSLRVVDAIVIDDSSVELVFSQNMEGWNSAQREFIIENTTNWEEIWIDISDIVPGNPKNILTILDRKLLPNTNYKVTVLDIRDSEGNTIESWIDAFVNFTTPETFIIDLESAWIQNPSTTDTNQDENNNVSDTPEDTNNPQIQDTNNPTENQQDVSVQSWNTPQWNNAGTTISLDDVAQNTVTTAANNEKLPQTWPEHWILLLVTVMLAVGMFYKFRA